MRMSDKGQWRNMNYFFTRGGKTFGFLNDCDDEFNVHWSVHRKNILICIQQDATLHSLFYLETALHVSGGTTTHHQERKQLYLKQLVFDTALLLSAPLSWKSWNWFECAVGGVPLYVYHLPRLDTTLGSRYIPDIMHGHYSITRPTVYSAS